MAEYIEREALIDNLNHFAPEHYNALINMLIEKQPAADVVEMVRCRECIHDGLTSCPLCYIEKHTLCFVNHDAEFYCGNGERRSE